MNSLPNSPQHGEITDKTAETDSAEVSNVAFLEVVFGALEGDAKPMLVSFEGNPGTVAKKRWSGHPWLPHIYCNEPQWNNYFSLATFRPDNAGRYRRKKEQFAGLYALMLDDIGTKVPRDNMSLPPSWLIETSPGNYQAGYLFAEPITDAQQADDLMKAVIAAELCDKGAGGPTARLARLPNAVNGKYEPVFHCRLEVWSPDTRYSHDELVDGFGLDLTPKSKKAAGRPSAARSSVQQPVWRPRPEGNPVLSKLQELGLYKSPLGEGKHDVTCPWVHEHTDAVDHGTGYFEPDDDWPIGGFHCFHGHCSERGIRDLITKLDVPEYLVGAKAIICVEPGHLDRIVDAAERSLVSLGQHYQRGGAIVSVHKDTATGESSIGRISQPALTRALAAAVRWQRWDERKGDYVAIDPPSRHVGVLHDSGEYRHFPVLAGLARQPFLRADNSLVLNAGYDAESMLFGAFDPSQFAVAESPTQDEAVAALAGLRELLQEFCFRDGHDEAAALSAILTASIRPSLPVAPMFHVRAHMPGSGKSYLCELITAFATPKHGAPTAFPSSEEECEKVLVAELLRAPAVIEFDNLTTDLLAYKSLCTMLTSARMSGRLLGHSRIVDIETRALILSSGNNVEPVNDIARRCITINLAPDADLPAQRDFHRPNLTAEVLGRRGEYVSAALTIVRAWLTAGSPDTPCRPLSGYRRWHQLCRLPLLWLGCPDPAESLYRGMTEDPERRVLGQLLEAWYALFSDRPKMIREVLAELADFGEEGADLEEILQDIAGEKGAINRRRLGRWLKRHSERRVDGKFLRRAESRGNAERWCVQAMGSVSSVLSVSNDSSSQSGSSREAA